ELLRQLVPTITTVIAMVISSIATAIEGIMLYSLSKSYLQSGLGIPSDAMQDTLPNHYNKRLELMNKINCLMGDITYTRKRSANLYDKYKNVLKVLNQDMLTTQLSDYSESTASKGGRYFLSAINIGFG